MFFSTFWRGEGAFLRVEKFPLFFNPSLIYNQINDPFFIYILISGQFCKIQQEDCGITRVYIMGPERRSLQSSSHGVGKVSLSLAGECINPGRKSCLKKYKCRFDIEKNGMSCAPSWMRKDDFSYNIFLFSVGFFLPLIVLMVTGIQIVKTIRKV